MRGTQEQGFRFFNDVYRRKFVIRDVCNLRTECYTSGFQVPCPTKSYKQGYWFTLMSAEGQVLEIYQMTW